MRFTERKVIATLRQNGYKLTPQRRAVIRTIVSSKEHLTPAAIYEKVHQKYPGIGVVTIYRTLGILDKLGLTCEVHAGGNCRSYLVRRPAEHHHHLLCSGCGTVVDFTNCNIGELQQRLVQESGFKIESHLLEFSGLCPDCQRMASK